jgi:hypothetical protein
MSARQHQNREIRLNDAGGIVRAVWSDFIGALPACRTDAFVVMPTHTWYRAVGLCDGAGLKPVPYALIRHGLPESSAPSKHFRRGDKRNAKFARRIGLATQLL